MLVLSRQRDETIVIADNIEITVVDIRGDKVRLGINAPPHIPVHRKEVYDAMKRERRSGEAEGKVESLANRKHNRGNDQSGSTTSGAPANNHPE